MEAAESGVNSRIVYRRRRRPAWRVECVTLGGVDDEGMWFRVVVFSWAGLVWGFIQKLTLVSVVWWWIVVKYTVEEKPWVDMGGSHKVVNGGGNNLSQICVIKSWNFFNYWFKATRGSSCCFFTLSCSSSILYVRCLLFPIPDPPEQGPFRGSNGEFTIRFENL